MVRTGERGTPVPRLRGAADREQSGNRPSLRAAGSREFTLRPVLDWVRIGAEPEKVRGRPLAPTGQRVVRIGGEVGRSERRPEVVAVDRAKDGTLA